jgi:hypothetical protein
MARWMVEKFRVLRDDSSNRTYATFSGANRSFSRSPAALSATTLPLFSSLSFLATFPEGPLPGTRVPRPSTPEEINREYVPCRAIAPSRRDRPTAKSPCRSILPLLVRDLYRFLRFSNQICSVTGLQQCVKRSSALTWFDEAPHKSQLLSESQFEILG